MLTKIYIVHAGIQTGTDSPVDGEYEDGDEEEYDEEDYETIVDKKPSVKVIKQEDLKSVSEQTTTIAPVTTTSKYTTSNSRQISSSKNYNLNTAENSKIFSQNSANQKQLAAISNPNNQKYQLKQTQNGKTSIHTAPSTTDGTTTSTSTTTSTTETPSTTIKPKSLTTTRHLPSRHVLNLNQHRGDQQAKITPTDGDSEDKTPDSYVTVTKSVTGSMDETKSPPEDKQKFASTYYTKSSTCGYFTFSCNTVYGANGRQKICRPKTPSNGKC